MEVLLVLLKLFASPRLAVGYVYAIIPNPGRYLLQLPGNVTVQHMNLIVVTITMASKATGAASENLQSGPE